MTIEQVEARLREVAQTQAAQGVDIEMFRREIRMMAERIGALENRAGTASQLAPAPAPRAGPSPAPVALRGWEPIPVTAIAAGYSPELHALRPEKYAGEPWGMRLVSRGDAGGATTYVPDLAAPAWVNFQAWERAGRPTRDALGRELDVRGYPLGATDFGPR